MATFGEKLSMLMAKHKYNRAGLARVVGVSGQTVTRWLKGESYPDLLQAQYMSRLLGDVSLDWWISIETDYPPPGLGIARTRTVPDAPLPGKPNKQGDPIPEVDPLPGQRK
jgi:transcriptional regulator with XRE-family HTH domain